MSARRNTNKMQDDVIYLELDLHGYTAHEAELAVIEIMEECIELGDTHVRIIVGKGTHSPNNNPVLPNVVKSILDKYPCTYTHAKPEHGGAGALEVHFISHRERPTEWTFL